MGYTLQTNGQTGPQVAYKHTKTTKDFFSKCIMIGTKVLHSSNKQWTFFNWSNVFGNTLAIWLEYHLIYMEYKRGQAMSKAYAKVKNFG